MSFTTKTNQKSEFIDALFNSGDENWSGNTSTPRRLHRPDREAPRSRSPQTPKSRSKVASPATHTPKSSLLTFEASRCGRFEFSAKFEFDSNGSPSASLLVRPAGGGTVQKYNASFQKGTVSIGTHFSVLNTDLAPYSRAETPACCFARNFNATVCKTRQSAHSTNSQNE